MPRARVGDFDGNGRVDVIAALQRGPRDSEGHGEIVRLDDHGRLVWSRALDDAYTFGDTAYGPGWFPDDVLAFTVDGKLRIAAAFHHHTWWPSVVVVMDAAGKIASRFVNAGWITALEASADGHRLFAAGISNAHGGAMLAVLDTRAGSGTGPMDGGSLPPCRDCPAGSPEEYLVAPWSDLAKPSNPPPVHVIRDPSGGIEWRAVQRPAPYAVSPELIITLDARLNVVQRNASDGFTETHRQLEKAGELTHPVSACPSVKPALRTWTPASGWTEIR